MIDRKIHTVAWYSHGFLDGGGEEEEEVKDFYSAHTDFQVDYKEMFSFIFILLLFFK